MLSSLARGLPEDDPIRSVIGKTKRVPQKIYSSLPPAYRTLGALQWCWVLVVRTQNTGVAQSVIDHLSARVLDPSASILLLHIPGNHTMRNCWAADCCCVAWSHGQCLRMACLHACPRIIPSCLACLADNQQHTGIRSRWCQPLSSSNKEVTNPTLYLKVSILHPSVVRVSSRQLL